MTYLFYFNSKDLLANAWDVEEEDVEKLLSGQSEVGFVKVKDEVILTLCGCEYSTDLLKIFSLLHKNNIYLSLILSESSVCSEKAHRRTFI